MITESTSTTTDKQITVAVPADRIPEFYAFYGRFLAGSTGRRRRHRSQHGCRSRHEGAGRTERQDPAAPEAREA